MTRHASKVIPPMTLLEGYCQGVFPMADSATGRINWYSANPRGIIDPSDFHTPSRLIRWLKHHPFEIRFDTAFEEVIQSCADREDTWISEDIRKSYIGLHQAGFAHSVEAWCDDVLVGGLYGVAIRGAFFGESMFYQAPNASKAAMLGLLNHLCERGFVLLDTQMITPATEQFGAILISQDEYQERLAEALQIEGLF